MIKLLSLFGGIGADVASLRNLNEDFKQIDYVEIDEKAVRSVNAMFAEFQKYKTQSVVGWNLRPDILMHGSPCQDFSIAGKQKGADKGSETRSSLMWETLRIIENLGVWKPKVVIWENVKNVLSSHMIHNFNNYIDEIARLGYTSNYKVLNAMDFGLPQNRNRNFVVSILNGPLFNFETLETRPMKHISNFLQTEFDEKYIVTQPSILSVIGKPRKGSKFKGYIKVIKNNCDTITTKQVRNPNAGVVEYEKGLYRYLTPLECWRLQGFTDEDFNNAKDVNCDDQTLYKQAGNSIPVPILEAIFKQVIQILEEMEGKQNGER